LEDSARVLREEPKEIRDASGYQYDVIYNNYIFSSEINIKTSYW